MVRGVWPHAVMEADRRALVAQTLARRLAEVMEERELSANALARKSGVNRQVITNVLNGMVWPDMITLLDLEAALDVMLWPQHTGWRIPAPGEAPEGVTEEMVRVEAQPQEAGE